MFLKRVIKTVVIACKNHHTGVDMTCKNHSTGVVCLERACNHHTVVDLACKNHYARVDKICKNRFTKQVVVWPNFGAKQFDCLL
jgi:hypothetical protein